ncbi:prephenate dehydrogenase [Kitasatospora sp. RB6PN24]|uniref:prephenate dehydrogenase n=1 Tax=Kitasatospora humi TaxID=2893891 RepID=UPI001E3FDF5D|nr:prephenate dehydrogenase [Kitasatospora humi]MCC9307865.1 prephenate dehydrogenase [Kitasatospora humi]
MRSAVVVGTGAIGTSIALALAAHGVSVHLDDVDSTAARTAEAMGAGTLLPPDGPVDLAVLAVPPAHIAGVLTRLQRSGTALAYTDVGSVKSRPQHDIEATGGDRSSYIGGHPLAGTERSGPLAARGDLFQGRPWVLTPSDRTERAVLNQALELVTLCSATPVVMDPVAHDQAVALTSHAPHLVSALMAARLAQAAEASIRISGQGLRDVTRIAAGDRVLWSEILRANADAVAAVLDAYAVDLGQAVTALRGLDSPDPEVRKRATDRLDAMLEQGNQGRARIDRKAGGPTADLAAVSVAITNQPGALARVFAAVGQLGVNIEDVRIEQGPDQPEGFVDLLVQREEAPRVARQLGAGGWAVGG